MTRPNPLLDPARRLVIGHRGASAHAPENTLPAFQLALDHGADALELDVHVSRDGIAVVHHDSTLDRTTNLTGPIAERTVAELRDADAGFHFAAGGGGGATGSPWRGRGAHVPTLAEVLETFPDTPIIIELKTARAQDAVARALLDHQAADRCVPAANELAAVTAFATPPFRRGASRPEIVRHLAGSLVGLPDRHARYRLLAVPDRHHGLPVATRLFFTAARRLGTPVHVWTVNDPARAARLWKAGACGIITDDPQAMSRLRPGS